MRKHPGSPLIFTPLLFIGVFWALASSSVLAGDPADHEALRKLAGIYEQTIKEANPELLKPHLADDFTGVMVTAEEVGSFQSLEEYWQKIQGLLGEGGTYSVQVNIPQPAEIVGDIAFAHGTTDDVAITSSGKEYRFTGRWTAICRKEGGQWKIVRIHGSMDPIENAFVAAAVKGAAYSAAGLAGIVSLIVGVGLTLLMRRRRSKSNASEN